MTATKNPRHTHLFLTLGLFGMLTTTSLGCTEDESSFGDEETSEEEVPMDDMRSGSATPALIGQWTFEPGAELTDATGRWGNLRLMGNASISNGQLRVSGSGNSYLGWTASGWAHAPGYSGSLIREKTLVSWVALDNLEVWTGSAMTIDNISGDNFDGIVFAEAAAYRWTNGSTRFVRGRNIVTVNETAVGQVVQMAISYRDIGGGNVEITICRNGVELGKYTAGSMAQWTGANAEIIFGKRHTNGSNQPGAIQGRIEEARIYGGAMTCAQIGAVPLRSDADADGVPDGDDECEGFDDHLDADGDGIADGCDLCRGDNGHLDTDTDGVCGDLDLCLGDDQSGDVDLDDVCNAIDNCVTVVNTDQTDADSDGTGDACDDEDSDGVIDVHDNCVSVANPDQGDSDVDGQGDVCDADDDNDTIADDTDNCALVANTDQTDTDDDGQGDACDGDDDDDGVLDQDDLCPGTPSTVAYDDDGCSGAQYVDRSCGRCVDYPNSGLYQSCVAQSTTTARQAGLIDNKERAGIVRAAAMAPCN